MRLVPMSGIIHSLEINARDTPDRTAITGSRSALTWRELRGEVEAACSDLSGCASLGLLLENSPAWIVADLAAMRRGVSTVPLPTFFSDAQVLHAIADAGVDTVITDDPARLESLLAVARKRKLAIAGGDYWKLCLSACDVEVRAEAAAKVTYTSGTTGAPRGVRLPLQAMETVAGALAEAAGASSDDRALVLLPLSILLENIGAMYVPILAGAQIMVPDAHELGLSGSSRIDGGRFAAALQRLRPTTMILPPQLLKLVVALASRRLLPKSLRYIAVGGAPTGVALLEAASRLGLPVYQGYGLSETCSVVALNTADGNRPGSVGRPLPHGRVRIDDSGEIFVAGTAFAGYLKEPDRDPDEEIATGDLGYLDDDGYLYVTGRCRHRIVTGYGRNISPEWVESELVSHPSIAQAAVLGDDLPYLVAVLVPDASNAPAGASRRLDQAVQEVNARLPDYARIGEYIMAAAPFGIGNGEFTPGHSPARDVIGRHYSKHIENILRKKNEHVL